MCSGRSHLLRYTSIQLVEGLHDMTPVNHWSAILCDLMQHKVMEEFQQVSVSCKGMLSFSRHAASHYR